MKKKVLICSLIFLTTILFSQEMKLYAPFPSRITAKTSGIKIDISWKDAKDVAEGNYEIYRAGVALTGDNLYLAEKIGEVPSGVGYFSDVPPLGTDFFYAVFVKDSNQVYKICIPYRNVTTAAVRINESDVEETVSTIISSLKARVIGKEVYLEYLSAIESRQTLLFRSTSMIDTPEILLKSVNIAENSGLKVQMTDTPMAGITYYYAAVDKELYLKGSHNLLYEGNYTTGPLHVKFSHEVEDDNRYTKATMPLPLLKLTSELETGALLNEQKTPEITGSISSGNLESIRRLVGKSRVVYKPLEASVLSYNKNINNIVSTSFLNRNWAESISRLENYISLSYDKETRNQSHFYRGQSYYFMGDYKRALLELIMVEKDLYVETRPFFSAIYNIQ